MAGFRAEDKCLIFSLKRFISYQTPKKLSPKEVGVRWRKNSLSGFYKQRKYIYLQCLALT